MKLCLFLLSLAGSAFSGLAAQENAPENDRVYLRIAVYAFEAHPASPGADVDSLQEPSLAEALEQAGALLGYQGFTFRKGTLWLVISDGDMNRPMDYPFLDLHFLSEHNRVKFTILYNHIEKYLTLKDFAIFDKSGKILHTTIGVADGGAAVLGSMKGGGLGDGLLVVTLKTSPKPFPGQSTKARFTLHHIENNQPAPD